MSNNEQAVKFSQIYTVQAQLAAGILIAAAPANVNSSSLIVNIVNTTPGGAVGTPTAYFDVRGTYPNAYAQAMPPALPLVKNLVVLSTSNTDTSLYTISYVNASTY